MTTTAIVTDKTCRWCGQRHGTKCPLVKSYEYFPNGGIRRVEFFAPNDYHPFPAPGPFVAPYEFDQTIPSS